MAGRGSPGDLPYLRCGPGTGAGLVGTRVCLPDKKVCGLPGSLCAHYGGSGSETTEEVNAMIRDLFSPTVPR